MAGNPCDPTRDGRARTVGNIAAGIQSDAVIAGDGAGVRDRACPSGNENAEGTARDGRARIVGDAGAMLKISARPSCRRAADAATVDKGCGPRTVKKLKL